MLKLNVRSKILLVLMTISTLSLCTFGWVVYDSFTNDKEAYIVETLLSETQSFTQLLNNKIEHYESFLHERISQKSINSLISENPEKINGDNFEVLGSGIDINGTTHVLTYSSTMPINKVKEHKLGEVQFAAIDLGEGIFSYSIKIKGTEAKSFVIFKDITITQYLINQPYKKTYLLAKNEMIGVESKINLDPIKQFLDQQTKAPFGFTKIEIDGNSYFLAFSQLDIKGVKLFTMVNVDYLFSYKNVFFFQTAGFVLLFLSISILIGFGAAKGLTSNLDKLSEAATSYGEGNFDHSFEIHTGDEIEVLGSTFNLMGNKINMLLEELRIYNTQLEEMVGQRTADLNHLTRIQNAMLNSLGQSFTIFDESLKIKPIYSKVTTDLLEADPVDLGPLGIMDIPPSERDSHKELLDHLFQETIEFEQLAALLPEKRSNSRNDTILLNYAPIRNPDTNKIEYVLTIGTDKTQEILSIEKSEKEIQFSRMLLSVMRNPTSVKRMMQNSFQMLDELQNINDTSSLNLKRAIRAVHTLKGSFSAFSIKEVQDFANDLESSLDETLKKENKITLNELQGQILSLKLLIENFIDSFGDLIHFNKSEVTIALSEAKAFRNKLSSNNVVELYDELFLSKRFKEYFELYHSYTQDLSIKLGKKASFEIIGGDSSVPKWFPHEIFDEFIHLLRNSMDHGIESCSERRSKGKNETGRLTLSFTSHHDKYIIEFKDDGKGIDLEALTKKDPLIITMNDAINKIILGGLSTKDEVSEVSGRGVGVSAIIEKVQSLGGNYEIITEKNNGTTFRFVLFRSHEGSKTA